MKLHAGILSIILFAFVSITKAQQPTPPPAVYTGDPNTSMAYDMARIANSVQTMQKTLKDFVDKFAKVEGLTLSEKQQKLVLGMEILMRAEQRAAAFQKQQIELVEKEGQMRSRLTQVEIDLYPQNIDRGVAFEGSTKTPEIKENRRRALEAERSSLQTVLRQLQSSLSDTSNELREAQNLVFRLRRTFLPQVERELSEQ